MVLQTHKNKSFFQALKHAVDGVVYSVKNETNMRTHCVMATIIIALSIVFQISAAEWLWVLQCIVFILFAELVNSALEKIVDAVTQQQYYTWAKHVKDMAAGAVLVSAIYTVCVGAIIFVPRVMEFIF
ncbi:diacylglycerol kinase family protein [Carnobacteriaceae bacterium zg-ZUI252]|nr:diacylglycerol kinase family protein [Carnobacteriaceae bacterium zg-ZUI252]MBS4770491.1 diacylglycerol kinase family protein [Carnobacteriaceae bacterium zg-ZUI240]